MLAIAPWEKGASWRAQGWVGENADRRNLASRSLERYGRPAKGNKQAWKEHLYLKNYDTDHATYHAGCRDRPVWRP